MEEVGEGRRWRHLVEEPAAFASIATLNILLDQGHFQIWYPFTFGLDARLLEALDFNEGRCHYILLFCSYTPHLFCIRYFGWIYFVVFVLPLV